MNDSSFIYLDTNIISYFVKNEKLWEKFHGFLRDSKLTLGLGGGQLSELSDAKSLLVDLARFLVSVPTSIIKNWDEIIDEEVEAHPSKRSISLLSYQLDAILLEGNGFEKFSQFLSSSDLADARKDQLQHAKLMNPRHKRLKSNFPPSSSGKYDRKQADEFVMVQVFQWLSHDHQKFLRGMQKDISQLNIDVFQSIRLFAYVIFYKYYLGQRQPNKLSDFGDLFHLFQIPYCKFAVMERDLANVLNQIKKNQNILNDTEILDIDFARSIENSP